MKVEKIEILKCGEVDLIIHDDFKIDDLYISEEPSDSEFIFNVTCHATFFEPSFGGENTSTEGTSVFSFEVTYKEGVLHVKDGDYCSCVDGFVKNLEDVKAIVGKMIFRKSFADFVQNYVKGQYKYLEEGKEEEYYHSFLDLTKKEDIEFMNDHKVHYQALKDLINILELQQYEKMKYKG